MPPPPGEEQNGHDPHSYEPRLGGMPHCTGNAAKKLSVYGNKTNSRSFAIGVQSGCRYQQLVNWTQKGKEGGW